MARTNPELTKSQAETAEGLVAILKLILGAPAQLGFHESSTGVVLFFYAEDGFMLEAALRRAGGFGSILVKNSPAEGWIKASADLSKLYNIDKKLGSNVKR